MPYTPQQARMILDNQFLPGKAMREGIAGREALRQQKQQGQRMEQQMRNDEARMQMEQSEARRAQEMHPLMKQRAEQEIAAAEESARRAEIDNAMAGVKQFNEIVAPITSEEQYNAALPALREVFPDLPDTYDPELVSSIKGATTEVDGLMKQAQQYEDAGNKEMAGMLREQAQAKSDLAMADLKYKQALTRQANAVAKNQEAEATEGVGVPGPIKSADSNAIYRQVVGYFGGIMDEDGTVRLLDPTVQKKVQGINAEAQRMFATKQADTHGEAINKALESFGFSDLTPPSEEDLIILREARAAIAGGASQEDVAERVRAEYGIDPAWL